MQKMILKTVITILIMLIMRSRKKMTIMITVRVIPIMTITLIITTAPITTRTVMPRTLTGKRFRRVAMKSRHKASPRVAIFKDK